MRFPASDPLAEVDVLLAYGRYDDAIRCLESAVAQHPARADLAKRLSELRMGRSQWLRRRALFEFSAALGFVAVGGLLGLSAGGVLELRVTGPLVMAVGGTSVIWALFKWNRRQ